MTDKLQNDINLLIEELNFKGGKKFKLIVIFGLLGDFDSFEYAINLSRLLKIKKYENKLDIFTVGIGTEKGKEKFCKFTEFPTSNITVVSDNKIHNELGISKGLDIGFGGWLNIFLMLSGIDSKNTIKEVLRGYTGDKKALQIYDDKDQVNILNIFKFSGNLFKRTCGSGYQRPFELATFRLNNMIEIISNWNDYILEVNYLPQRGATFILDQEDNIVYEYLSKEILSYSKNMSIPLDFISKIIK